MKRRDLRIRWSSRRRRLRMMWRRSKRKIREIRITTKVFHT
jgi:hypothetical protein